MTIDPLMKSSQVIYLFIESRLNSISNTRLNQMLFLFLVYLFLLTPIEQEINNLDGALYENKGIVDGRKKNFLLFIDSIIIRRKKKVDNLFFMNGQEYDEVDIILQEFLFLLRKVEYS